MRVPVNIWERVRNDQESKNQRSLAIQEARRLVSLHPGTPLTITYDLSVESINIGEIVACLFLAKYLSRAKFPVNFVLAKDPFKASSESFGEGSYVKRIAELQSIATQMSRGEFDLTFREGTAEDEFHVEASGHRVFQSHSQLRTPIVHAALIIFSIPEFVGKFGDPKTLVDWKPSGYIGWHVRSSRANSARNYWSDNLLAEDAKTLASNFPDHEIRVFTDEGGREKFEQAASRIASLKRMLGEGQVSFQHAADFPGAAIEAAGCEFWFQRLGGGIGMIPMFSKMPFLILTEDFRVTNLVAAKDSSFYPWHHSAQGWILSAHAAFRKFPTKFVGK